MSVNLIYNMGDDAFANLYEMSFAPVPFLGGELQNIILRVQNFTIPEITQDTYEVPYKTLSIDKPNGKANNIREFSFDIRVDRLYAVYKAFISWRNAIANPVSGSIGPDNSLNNNRTDVTVWAVDPSGVPIPNFGNWTFKGAWCKGVGSVNFDNASGDPIVTTITMGCLTMDDTLL